MSDEKWIQVLKEVCEMRPKQITISGGGEPLMRMNLVSEMIKEIKKYGIEEVLITDGTLFNDELIRNTVLNKLDEVRISLHSSSQELDHFLRGDERAFKKSIGFIQKVLEYKQKHKSLKPLVCLWYVITKFNLDEIENFINFGVKMKIDEIKFRIVNEGNVKELLPESYKLNEVLRKIQKIKKKYFSHIKIDCMFPVTEANGVSCESSIEVSKNCVLPLYEMVIFADGRISPCCNFIDVFNESIVDNVMNKSVKEIWNGEIFNKFREGKMNSVLKCKGCTPDMRFLNEEYKRVR
jgi:radical SAM protein with 4Fe4S-binding SPASM domain